MNLMDLPPDKEFGTDNDDEARAFLSAHGLLQKMEPPGAGDGLLPPQVRRFDIWNHPTHWITVLRAFNFLRPEDNGYVVSCLPKSRLGRAAFAKQLAREAQEMFTQGHTSQLNDWPEIGTN